MTGGGINGIIPAHYSDPRGKPETIHWDLGGPLGLQ